MSESGSVVVMPQDVHRIRKAACEWTNMTHAAVLFEVSTLCSGLGTTRADLTALGRRIDAARERWRGPDRPDQWLVTRRLALTAATRHAEDCRRGTGRLRRPKSDLLEDLLPKRSGTDLFFRVPDIHGDVPAGLTLDYDEFGWHAEATAHASASEARQAPLAKIAFARLAQARVPPFGGGKIVTDNGDVVLSFS